MFVSGRLAFGAAMLLVGIASMHLVVRVSAAAPHVIVVEGDLLDEPVLLQDWSENLALTQSIEGGRGAIGGTWDPGSESRPRLDLLYFWIVADAPVSSMSQLGAPEGRIPFWPAVGDDVARMGMGQVADAQVLAILERHGVPTRVERSENEGSGRPLVTATIALGILGGIAVLVTRAALRRRA